MGLLIEPGFGRNQLRPESFIINNEYKRIYNRENLTMFRIYDTDHVTETKKSRTKSNISHRRMIIVSIFRMLNFHKWDEYSIDWIPKSSTCKFASATQDRWNEILNIVSPNITSRWRHIIVSFSSLTLGLTENYNKAFRTKSVSRNIIEGDQNQVAVFSLEYFLNLTRAAWAYENAYGSFLINQPALAPLLLAFS